MKKVIVTAPGKVIVHGEHAVVFGKVRAHWVGHKRMSVEEKASGPQIIAMHLVARLPNVYGGKNI